MWCGWKTSRTSPLPLRWWNLPVAGHDARCVLPAMLQRGEGVVEFLVDVGLPDDSDDTAHRSRTPVA